MQALSKRVLQFLVDEDGPTAIEYAAIFLLLVLAALTVITAIGRSTAGDPSQL
jgi:Flp pilus assembly pilin Flp